LNLLRINVHDPKQFFIYVVTKKQVFDKSSHWKPLSKYETPLGEKTPPPRKISSVSLNAKPSFTEDHTVYIFILLGNPLLVA
jgi:citrate lyase synthetase